MSYTHTNTDLYIQGKYGEKCRIVELRWYVIYRFLLSCMFEIFIIRYKIKWLKKKQLYINDLKTLMWLKWYPVGSKKNERNETISEFQDNEILVV